MNNNEYIKSISGKSFYETKDLHEEVILSKLNKFNNYNDRAIFSVKVVLSGTEHYRLNGNLFNIDKHSFLVVNPNSEVELTVEKQATRGICLFPSIKMVKDIFRNKITPENQLLDNPFDSIPSTNFTEKKHDFKENATGQFLTNQINLIYNSLDKSEGFDAHHFYWMLSEFLIQDQVKIEHRLKALNSSKKSTKEELYRRVDVAKKYIEDNYSKRINLDELASTAFLSKYHFTRSFKALYHLSPIQYVLQLRLQKATELLSKNYSYAEVTDLVGFSDVRNLRKALKRNHVA